MDDIDAALSHHRSGRLAEAEALYRQALLGRPDDAEATHLLGMLCHQTGRNDEALPLLRRSVELAPGAAHFHGNLGGVLIKLGIPAEAEAHLRQALRLAPASAEAANNLAVALEALGRLDEAEALLRDALGLRPDYVQALNNLGNVLRKAGRAPAAVEQYHGALRLQPDSADAWGNLAAALTDLARHDEALAAHRRAAELAPADALLNSRLLFDLHYSRGDDAELLHAEHAVWAARHAPLHLCNPAPFANLPGPGRRLRVGYVSPDFRDHPVARFFEPLLDATDRGAFEVFCYSDVIEPDAVTDRLRASADAWRPVRGLSDEQLALRVRDDRVDVLVDLAGHMGAHRLLAFARRAAPVQVTYLGYPDTTGLAAMDYRITDSRHDPPGETEQFHSERLVRLDPCCWCYRPEPETPEDVGPPPAVERGAVTFAVLNKPAKITDAMARLWSRILDATGPSRLMILGGADLRPLLERGGVPAGRTDFVPRQPRRDYLRLYHEVDVALDTFPYNGHTTTCDALWMGVPVVTLAGPTHVSRAGLSVLSAAGLDDLVARTPEDYVRTATALAADPARLASLRSSLRPRVAACPLRDEAGFALRLGAAYRAMWAAWCESSATNA